MTQSEKKITKSKLDILIDKPLHKVDHFEGAITFTFLVDETIYDLSIICSMRFYKDDSYIFASHDMYQPIDSLFNYDDFVWDTFPWHEKGNNKLDKAIERHFNNNFNDYVVKSMQVKQFGDLTIQFTNGYTLEIFSDASGFSENWRFGIQGAEKPLLLVAGIGLDHELMK